jgi:hypothetical protein
MKKVLHIFIIISCVNFYAQNENANWFFGNGAGLQFNANSTSVLTSGKTASLGKHTSSISDTNGNLLFYTDGNTVWDKNHNIMPNGNNSINSDGSTVIICPFPNDINKYYIFTRKDIYHPNGFIEETQYYYSIINLSTSNGFVESLNNLLIVPVYIPGSDGLLRTIAQRDHMSLARHSNNQSYWLIINPHDYHFAFEISASGIGTPVISKADGNYSTGNPLETIYSGSSGMSVSRNNKKIAYVSNFRTPGSNGGGASLYIYNFDNSNGNITLDLSEALGNSGFINFTDIVKGSSVEFSSNSHFLYIMGITPYNSVEIVQFDLKNKDKDPYTISSLTVNFPYNTFFYTMRLGLDGKIYIPHLNTQYLSIINEPNNFGSNCNFSNNQIYLNGKSTLLLPQQKPYDSFDCVLDEFVGNNVYVVDFVTAQNSITANNIINTNASAEYDAGLKVLLQPGFHAKSGSTFRAFIEGCSAISNKTGKKSSKISTKNVEEELKNNFTIYPNPSKGIFSVSANNLINSYRIVNQIGKTTISKPFVNEKDITIDIQKYPLGIYFIQLQLENGEIEMKKIIKN